MYPCSSLLILNERSCSLAKFCNICYERPSRIIYYVRNERSSCLLVYCFYDDRSYSLTYKFFAEESKLVQVTKGHSLHIFIGRFYPLPGPMLRSLYNSLFSQPKLWLFSRHSYWAWISEQTLWTKKCRMLIILQITVITENKRMISMVWLYSAGVRAMGSKGCYGLNSVQYVAVCRQTV
jgi:hypothetical protein